MPGRVPRHDDDKLVEAHSGSGKRATVYAAARGDPDLPRDTTESERALASLPYLARVLVDADYAAKVKQLKTRELALEEDFNARKGDLIKTFDRIRAGLEAKEKELAEREAGRPAKGGAL